ncbi:MAG: SLBB domain-containing protein, partial [Pseudomonadota bacterium]
STYNKDVFLTLTKVRQMSIMVIGNVVHPGQVTLSTFNTVLDALAAAGGVEKTGTLRQIKLIRNNQGTIIDLYGVLVYGSATSDLSLRDGDKIIVGNIGPCLAVAGAVKRPAIYEILPANRSLFIDRDDNSQKLSRNDLLDFAGDALTPANTRYLRFDVNNSDTDVLSDVPNGMLRIFSDGDILYVGQASKNNSTRIAGSIEVKGTIPTAGIFALAEIPSLSYILKNKDSLNSDAYPLLGVIERWNSEQMSREFIPFSPQRIISGRDDIKLDESDNVIFFSRNDIYHMQAPLEQDSGTENDGNHNVNLSSPNYSAELQNFLTEHSVFLRGSVYHAGSYPIANETSLESLLSVAGGPSLEASLSNVEITQPLADKSAHRSSINLASMPASLITLHPGDTIRINQKFRKLEDRHVLLAGEVTNPGTYDLIAGDTLSSLIARAGGLTEQAYPKGAIFSRKSERLREEERYKNEARALELSLANAMQLKNSDNKPNPQEVALAQDLIAQLKGSETLGRLTVEADPTMLTSNPDLDILLESGDKIYVPKRPLTVRVAGEVLSPAALQFRTGKNPRDYINESGGFTYNADSDRAFVVYPNGSAQPLAVSSWNQSAVMIPPGSTIIVPRDPKPLTFMDGAKDLSQILANLATTAIFAEDLRDKN